MAEKRTLIIIVHGEAAPQGSKIPGRSAKTGKMFVREQNSEKQKNWRQDVIAAATTVRELVGWDTIDGAVDVVLDIRIRRPASVSLTRRPYPSVKPDLDKMIRNTLDGLTAAGVFRDDAQVINLNARKRYATDDPSGGPGATIYVSLVQPPEII